MLTLYMPYCRELTDIQTDTPFIHPASLDFAHQAHSAVLLCLVRDTRPLLAHAKMTHN